MNDNDIGSSKTYQDMLGEVEKISREVAAPDLDLDVLVNRVERGYHLIKEMRARLESTKDKVEKLRLHFAESN